MDWPHVIGLAVVAVSFIAGVAGVLLNPVY